MADHISAPRGNLARRRAAQACGLCAALLMALPTVAHGQVVLNTIWSFSGTDGATIYGGLIRDKKGNLYGVTGLGGASNMGRAFELSPPASGAAVWTYAPIWDFSGPDGNYSETTLLRDGAGNLYGTMVNGGAANDGTVFELTPPNKLVKNWTEQTLWSFSGADAANPYNGLIMDKAGNLYGTATYGGTNDFGSAFELSPPAAGSTGWTENTIWSFGGPEGQTPVGALFQDSIGNLFGPAQWGGSSNNGTVFELSPPAAGQTAWTAAPLSNFAGPDSGDGMTPYPALASLSGGYKFFGTTLNGGPANSGSVFQMLPPTKKQPAWTRNTIWTFSNSDGCCAFGKLLIDKSGAVFGTTGFGGPNNAGTVFKLTPPAAGQTAWTETVLWNFSGPDGANPGDALIVDSQGVLYGTTGSGGANNQGSVFSLSGSGFVVR